MLCGNRMVEHCLEYHSENVHRRFSLLTSEREQLTIPYFLSVIEILISDEEGLIKVLYCLGFSASRPKILYWVVLSCASYSTTYDLLQRRYYCV